MHSRAQWTWDTTHGIRATRTAMDPVLPYFFGKTQGFHSSIIGRIRKWIIIRQSAKDKQQRWIWCDSLGRCLNLGIFWVSVVLVVSKHLPNPSCVMANNPKHIPSLATAGWYNQTGLPDTPVRASNDSQQVRMVPMFWSTPSTGSYALGFCWGAEQDPYIRKGHKSHRWSIYR